MEMGEIRERPAHRCCSADASQRSRTACQGHAASRCGAGLTPRLTSLWSPPPRSCLHTSRSLNLLKAMRSVIRNDLVRPVALQWGRCKKKRQVGKKAVPLLLKNTNKQQQQKPLYFKHVQTTNSWLLLRMEWPYDNSHFYFFYFNDV